MELLIVILLIITIFIRKRTKKTPYGHIKNKVVDLKEYRKREKR